MVKKDTAQKLTYPFLYKPALPSIPAFVIPMSEDKESMNEVGHTYNIYRLPVALTPHFVEKKRCYTKNQGINK